MRVNGTTWVVTGAGNGMGRELVLALLQRGARVAAVDIRADALQQTSERAAAGDRLSVHVADITDRDAVARLVDAVQSAHPGIDGIINNAGIIQPFVPVAELDDATIHRVLDVNLMGTIYMVRAFLPILMERPAGYIANVSSMGGFFPFPGQSIYGASKAAVKLLTEGLYAELLDTSVNVSVIMPGAVNTDITANSGVAAPSSPGDASRMPMTSATRAAEIMLDGIERNRLYIYVGKDARLMNIAIRVLPRQSIRLVRNQMQKLVSGAQASVR